MRAASPEAALRGALDAAPAPVRLWWRDDDAGRDHPRLAALLDIARRREAPLALAVVPAWLEPACAARVLACPLADVLQHGISHGNHGRPPAKKIELGGAADPAELRTTLAAMRVGLAERFGARALPVLVPPWNRIAPDLLPALPGLGFVGWSGFGPRPAPLPVPGLVQVNTHLDPIAWRGDRSLTDPDALVAKLAHSIDSRLYGANHPEPIGVLTHHLAHDEAVWTFCEALLEHLAAHAAVRFPSINAVFSVEVRA